MNIAIVSFGDSNVSQWSVFSFEVLTRYADLHGYECHIYSESLDTERPPAWSKILYLLKHLDAYDWLVWIDTDCIIEQVQRPIEDFLSHKNDVIFCLGGDLLTLNSGVIIIRNTAWAKTYLQTVYDQDFLVNNRYLLALRPEDYQKRQDCGCDGCRYFCYDQKAFIHVLHHMDDQEVERHVAFRSTSDREKCFQSYDEAYWPGCFIHHFPGNRESKHYIRFIESSRIALKKLESLSSATPAEKVTGGENDQRFSYDEPVDYVKLLRYLSGFAIKHQLMVYWAILGSFFFRLTKPRKHIGKFLSLKRIEQLVRGKNNRR